MSGARAVLCVGLALSSYGSEGVCADSYGGGEGVLLASV